MIAAALKKRIAFLLGANHAKIAKDVTNDVNFQIIPKWLFCVAPNVLLNVDATNLTAIAGIKICM